MKPFVIAALLFAGAEDEPTLTLARGKTGVQATAAASLPDRAEAVFTIVRLDERVQGARLLPFRSEEMRSEYPVFQRGKAAMELRASSLCLYEVEWTFDPSRQCDNVRSALPAGMAPLRMTGRVWTGAPARAVERLAKAAEGIAEVQSKCVDLLDRCTQAAQLPGSWDENKETLIRETDRLQGTLGKLLLAEDSSRSTAGNSFRRDAVFTATAAVLRTALSELRAYLGMVEFDGDGTRKPPIDYHTGKPIVSACGRELDLDSVRGEVAKARRLLIREASLYLPKLARPVVEASEFDSAKLSALGAELLTLIRTVRGEEPAPDEAVDAAEAVATRMADPGEESLSTEALLSDLTALEEQLRTLPE